MKIKKTILFTLTSAFLFTGCGGLSDAKKAITNQKMGGDLWDTLWRTFFLNHANCFFF